MDTNVNDNGTSQGNSAISVPLAMEDTRRQLIAKRVAAGADTPIGHRCSNLIELLENYAKVESEEQRSHIEAGIRKQMAELAIRHQ